MNTYFLELPKAKAIKNIFFQQHLTCMVQKPYAFPLNFQKASKLMWRGATWEKFLLEVKWFDLISLGKISVLIHSAPSLSWWSSKVRSGCPWSVHLRTFDWQTAELLSANKATAVCLACAKPSVWIISRYFGWKLAFQQPSWRRPVGSCVRTTAVGFRSVWKVSVLTLHPPNKKGVSSLSLITFLGKHAEETLNYSGCSFTG